MLPNLPELTTLIQVGDGDLLDGAIRYEDALAAAGRPTAPVVDRSPDDLYILCTGGTTGMPKGVLWRQADIYVGSMGGRDLSTGEEFECSRPSLGTLPKAAAARCCPRPRSCTAPATGWRSTRSTAATPS